MRAIEAQQVLRAAQVAACPTCRAYNTQTRSSRLGRPPGPWIGEAIALSESPPPSRSSAPKLAAARDTAPSCPRQRSDSPGFLKSRATRFVEEVPAGSAVAEVTLEHVEPKV